MKGHIAPGTELKFKDGDKGRFLIAAQTTDRLLILDSLGRFFTLSCAALPSGRGMGEPLRLMVDLPNEARIVTILVHQGGRRFLLASNAGDGFLVAEDEVLAQTRAGKQVMNLGDGARAAVCVPVTGDHVAVVGENRKMVVFPLADLPEMVRGKGVRLQSYKDGGLADATTLTLAAGLSWKETGGRTRTEPDLTEWLGKRASAGRMAPRGFPGQPVRAGGLIRPDRPSDHRRNGRSDGEAECAVGGGVVVDAVDGADGNMVPGIEEGAVPGGGERAVKRGQTL
jgi:topoisomerase IV subunit A